jgi:hypothetical protein
MRRTTVARVGLTLGLGLSAARDARAQAPTPTPPPEAKIAAYGLVFVNAYGNSGGTNNVDIPLFAGTGEGNFGATARGTRLGIRLSGATVGRARLGGLIEADFFGGFAPVGVGDNMGIVRLRSAAARLEWTTSVLVAGQDWMIFAPANPVSLACTGIPLMAASGNPWARLPQLRVERRAGAATLQAGVLAPSTGDFSSTFLAQPGSGGLGRVPFVQARVAAAKANALGSGKPASLGVSGHWGRSRTPVGTGHVDVDTAAGALDLSLPLGNRVTLTGEAFTGKNLAGFQAGVFQGLNPDPAALDPRVPRPGPQAITTAGGWAQLGWVLPGVAGVTLYGTYGLEDPDDADLASVARRDWRLRNRTAALSFVHKLSDRLSWGIEARQVQTRLLQSGEKENTHVNAAASLGF